jgi:hypothetical protein
MRSSIVAFGFVAALAPAIAAAQGAPPPATVDPNAAPPAPTAPPPTYAPPPAQPTYAPPPQQTYAPPPPPVVVAEPAGGSSPKGLSVWGIFPWQGYGAGARFMMPVAIQPLLRSSGVKDNFALEFGADFVHWNAGWVGGTEYGVSHLTPVFGLMWNIWLMPQFAVYPKVELGYSIGWVTGWENTGPRPGANGIFWDATGGLLYKLNNGLTLRAEAGYAAVKLGVGWLF